MPVTFHATHSRDSGINHPRALGLEVRLSCHGCGRQTDYIHFFWGPGRYHYACQSCKTVGAWRPAAPA